MPVFQLQTQDGRQFEVDAPSMEIAASSLNDHLGGETRAPGDKGSVLGNIAEPITDLPGNYSNLVDQSVDQMKRGYHQLTSGEAPAHGIANMALGGIGYATSPINAAVHSLIGGPIEHNTGSEALGSYADLAASLALPIPKGLPRLGGVAEKAAPTSEELYAAAKSGFQHPEVERLALKPKALAQWAQNARVKLTEAGADDVNAPKVWAILDKVDSAPPGSFLTGKNLKSLRESLANQAIPESLFGPRTQNPRAASIAIDSLDQLLGNVAASDVLRGDPAKVAKIWNEARANYAAAKRADRITEALDQAELQAGSAHSGQNIDNATRQRIKAILKNPKARRGYSADELAQMRRVVMGTFTGDKARFIANVFGKGGGLGTLHAMAAGAGAGYAAGGEVGALTGAMAPTVGYAFSKLSNAITAREVEKLQNLIRSRSPLAAQMSGPMTDWSKAAVSFQASSTPKNIARLLIASRNLANNLKDAGITVSAENLIGSLQGPSPTEANPDRKGDK